MCLISQADGGLQAGSHGCRIQNPVAKTSSIATYRPVLSVPSLHHVPSLAGLRRTPAGPLCPWWLPPELCGHFSHYPGFPWQYNWCPHLLWHSLCCFSLYLHIPRNLGGFAFSASWSTEVVMWILDICSFPPSFSGIISHSFIYV